MASATTKPVPKKTVMMTQEPDASLRSKLSRTSNTSLASVASLSMPLVQEIVLSADIRCSDCQERVMDIMSRMIGNDIAKYLKEDVPRLVNSQHVTSVEKILSVVFKSLPADFNQFIKWVAEIRRTEEPNQMLSAEEKSRLTLKQDALKQVHETELFKHGRKRSSSEI